VLVTTEPLAGHATVPFIPELMLTLPWSAGK